jgi:hypothetical protein
MQRIYRDSNKHFSIKFQFIISVSYLNLLQATEAVIYHTFMESEITQ